MLYTYIEQQMTRYALEMQTLKDCLFSFVLPAKSVLQIVCCGDHTISKYQIAN